MENCENLIKDKKYDELILLLINENKELKKTFNKEVDKMRSDVSTLQQKIKYLEKQNNKIMKQHNVTLVNKYSRELLIAIFDEDFEYFKDIIETEIFPINEYIMDETEKTANFSLLHYSVKKDLYEFTEFLILAGAELNIPDLQDNWTPLMYSVQNKNYDIAKLLLEKGADVNFKDVDEFTPLSIAVDTSNKEMVELLLSFKPKLDNLTELIEITTNNDHKEIIGILEKYKLSSNQ